MSVIERLYDVLLPLCVDDGYDDSRNIMPAVPDALTWRPRPVRRRWRSTVVARIDAAGAALSTPHIWRRMYASMRSSITLNTREMGYLRGLTES